MVFFTPLRCAGCLKVIKQKPKAKIPKYCPQCREIQQNQFKKAVKQERQKKFRG